MFVINTRCLCSPGSQNPFARLLLCIFQHFVSLIACFSLTCQAVVCKSAAGNRGAFLLLHTGCERKKRLRKPQLVQPKQALWVPVMDAPCLPGTARSRVLNPSGAEGWRESFLKMRLPLLHSSPFSPAVELCRSFSHDDVQSRAGVQAFLGWGPGQAQRGSSHEGTSWKRYPRGR